MLKLSMTPHSKKTQKIIAIVIIFLVTIVGTIVLTNSHAQSPYASTTADTGIASAGALKQSCSGSSDGTCVVFPVQQTTNNVTPTVVGHSLQLGTTGQQLKMHGVVVWGVEDTSSTTFGVSEYNNRQAIINNIKAWGGNEIRLRVQASDYNTQKYMTNTQELQEIKDWQTTAQAAGLYLGVTWWDGLDGPYGGANWATNYNQAFPMMTAVINALGANNPWVFYEPFNEPDNVSESAWLTAMTNTIKLFRSDSYKGILLLDTIDWSHAYNDSDMTALETTDAGQASMNGKNQIIFAKHDYANESYANPDSGFDSTHWANNDSGTSPWNFTNHLIWETEFGNYNGSPSTVHPAWSAGAATWMAQKVSDGTLVGATGFLYGPWFDANAMTGSDNITPTQWGGYVKNNFLANVH